MYTYEMIGVADQNNKVYESRFGTYSKDTGFVLNDIAYSITKPRLLYLLTHENCWSLKVEEPKRKKMTIDDIEKALGYKIDLLTEDKTNTKTDSVPVYNVLYDILYKLFEDELPNDKSEGSENNTYKHKS